MVRQVDVETFCARMNGQDRHEVQRALAAGMGMARDGDKTVSYGTREAYLSGQPPKMLDGNELSDFVPATPTPASMVSPLKNAVMGPPQISRPRVDPSMTERPSVEFETRTSRHPRGDSEYLDAQRLVPGREQEPEPLQPEPLTEGEAWLADRLGRS